MFNPRKTAGIPTNPESFVLIAEWQRAMNNRTETAFFGGE